jgi:hypothetical protein
MSISRILPILVLLAGAGPAAAADAPAGSAPPPVGVCARSDVLTRIAERFAWAERETWRRGFTIASLHNPRPSGHLFHEPGIVKRDYCMAEAVMTNGRQHIVYYAVEHDLGFASIGDYVDFCVLGLDPWRVHDGACRTVQ